MASDPKRVIASVSDFTNPRVRAWDPFAPNPAEELERARKAKEIPPRYWPALDNLEETPAVVAVRTFIDWSDPRTFLVLAGAPGTGKTVAGCYGLDVYKGRTYDNGAGGTRRGPDQDGAFLKVADLAAGLFDRDLWDHAAGAPRLVLDDLGMETAAGQGREHFLGRLVALLHERYDYERKTIITCNLTREVFTSTYLGHDGGRLADRFRECGWFEAVTGASRRRPVGSPSRAPSPAGALSQAADGQPATPRSADSSGGAR